jgi:hypothetical protein
MSTPDTAAIDKAIMALPLKAGANLGHTLHLARRCILDAMAVCRTAPKPSSEGRIRADLEKLAGLASGLHDHIASGMCHEAISLAGQDLQTTEFLELLRVVAERAKAADWRSPPAKEMTLIAGETHSLVAKVGGAAKRGAPRNSAASKLAGAASAAYEGYTGKRATVINDPITNDRGGPFVEFVEAIFKAAGIDANAANFAKEAAKIRYQVFGPNPVKSGG